MIRRWEQIIIRNARTHCLEVVYYTVVLLIGIWFFFFLGEEGYILEKDSYTYLGDKHWVKSYGYIVYPLFLKMCRWFWGEMYIDAIFIIQSLLALLMSLLVTEYVRKKYLFSRKQGVLVFVLSFGPYTYTLPQYVANHGILTEGITFPLYNLWMICAIELYRNKKLFWNIALLVISILMTITRPPLLVFLVAYIILVLDVFRRQRSCIERKNNEWKRRLINFSIGVVVIFAGVMVFGLIIRNAWFPQLTDAVAGRILCTVEKDDINLYSEELKPLFEAVYYEIDERGDRITYFRNDYKRWEDICISTNNNTTLVEQIITENKVIINGLNNELSNKSIKGELIYPLLLKHWDDYLVMTGELFLQSLVVAIFIHPDGIYLICCLFATLMYVVSIILLYILKKKRMWEYIAPMSIVLIVIAIMCGLTNVVFMGVQRYVVYAFGWFYIAIVVMLHGFLSLSKDQRKK